MNFVRLYVSLLYRPLTPYPQNLNISSFEPHIRGACNLIKLCLESPTVADFYFASSVSSVMAWPGPGPVPEAVTNDTSVAQGMGYEDSAPGISGYY